MLQMNKSCCHLVFDSETRLTHSSLFVFEVREAEVRIDATIGPVEESFALLNKHELLFNDGNAERVDGLTYAWKNLNALVRRGRRGGKV